ncbi:hypothetical protein CQ12_05515 [Bradyrhizobium jicamae]|uniref:Uncharacterized protein n=1 Tax=Bradyrhizobium jicamae TaxID=280332 RepID=A0A0R3M052_9BRAD|nr:hypothetical protein CQ12_05515 [Bradyrhizobium jicamae]
MSVLTQKSAAGEPLIHVERGAEVRPGVFAWHVPVLGLSGRSRQPLLDACREIQSILGATGHHAAVFRPGRAHWDIRCSVEWGAAHTVKETRSGTIRFAVYRPFQDGDSDSGQDRAPGVAA